MRPNTGVFTAILLTAMTLAQPQVGIAQETQTKETAPVSGSEIDDNTARVILQFLLSNKQDPHTFPCTAVLANDTQESLSRRFTLKYVFKGDGILPSFEVIDNSASTQKECQINVTQVPPSENAPVRFFQQTFIEKNRAYLDNNEIESQLSQFEVVMSGPWHKQYYTRQGSIVAMFFAGDVDGRVIPNESTFHLLFFGYDRESLSENEAKALRSHVIASIKEWNSNDLPVTSISHAFNRSSLAFEEKIGLQPVLLRVSENSNEA